MPGNRRLDERTIVARALISDWRLKTVVVGDVGGSTFRELIQTRSFLSQGAPWLTNGLGSSSCPCTPDSPALGIGLFGDGSEAIETPDRFSLRALDDNGLFEVVRRSSLRREDGTCKCERPTGESGPRISCNSWYRLLFRELVSCITISSAAAVSLAGRLSRCPTLGAFLLDFFQGFTQSLSNGPRSEAESMKSGVPFKYDSASLSILCRRAAHSASSSSSSEPSTPSISMSEAEGEHSSRESGEVGGRGGIWLRCGGHQWS